MKSVININLNSEEVAEKYLSDFLAWLPKEKKVTIAVSGGSTPKIFFQKLSQAPLTENDWKNIHLFWVDERCVPPDDPQSNYKMTREFLLDHIPIPENNIHRMKGEADPEQEAERYQKEIQEFVETENGWPKFNLILLGMGGDGHTASIFPDNLELLEAKKICAVATHPESGQKRITLTGKVINNAQQTAFLVTGAGKSTVVAEILRSEGDWKSYPASYIDPAGMLFWYLDESAAVDYKAPLD